MLFRSLVLCVFFIYGPVTSAKTGKLTVFVSIPPQKFIVENIGGERVEVNVMLSPGQSPETFEPSPKKIESLSAARIYFLIGVPFESAWMDTMQETNNNMIVIDYFREGDYDKPVSPDPHVWTSPVNVKKIAEIVRDALIREDPDGKSYYEKNYARFAEELVALDEYIRTTLAQKRTIYFVVSHASWGFYAREYGLKQIALESMGREAGSRFLTRVLNIINEQGIRTIFVQEQYRTPVAEALSREINGNIQMLDPLAENYIENIMDVTNKIAEAIK